MNRELLDKWLNGTISPSELEVLKQDQTFLEYLQVDSIIKRLELPDTSTSAGLDDLKRRKDVSAKPKVIGMRSWMKFAAAAAAVLLIGLVYVSQLPSTFETHLAETELIKLPDGSQVTLNANSYLEFNKRNWNKDRKVTLQGEAFFDVAKGEKFEVHTDHGIVSVLGTQFNVSDSDGQLQVVCYEGRVGVSTGDEVTQLGAGDAVSIVGSEWSSAKKYTKRPGWIYNESSFENARLAWVLEELETVYAINIISENIDVDLRYTGSFTNTDLDSALETITLPMRLEYVIENKNVILTSKD
ncbi:MAG: FecR domain-containing protein [Bacteroidota bacterium]